MYIEGETITDLRNDEDFKPMITEEEHTILLERYNKLFERLMPKEIKKENEELMPLPR